MKLFILFMYYNDIIIYIKSMKHQNNMKPSDLNSAWHLLFVNFVNFFYKNLCEKSI